VLSDEKDAQGRTHYDRIREYYRDHPDAAQGDYDADRYYDRKSDRLTDLFYKGDRSMRESGFDPSNRFGLFNIDVIHYAPVCLNSLLYRMETEAAAIEEILGNAPSVHAWKHRAEARRQAIDRYLWDEASGLYLDYNFETKTRRKYEFATTFYPLWAGAASKEQAQRVHDNLKLFEAPGGLLTSTRVTGNQWDAPYGWAPLQMIGLDGLRRSGYDADADRISRSFLSMVTQDFEEHGAIVEKYDVQRRRSDVAAGIKFGYSANQVGFGWTNAAFLDLLAGLEHKPATKAAEADGAGIDRRAYALVLRKENLMPLYMSQFAYTPEAWANLTRNPQDRTEALRELAQKLGGKLVSLYYSFGEHDGIVLSDVPDDTSAAALAMAAVAAGHVRSITTTRLFTAAEAIAAMKKAGAAAYKPPRA
jgi:uncharacterized protein with GYD domain